MPDAANKKPEKRTFRLSGFSVLTKRQRPLLPYWVMAAGYCSYTRPWSSMALPTLRKPAMFAPAT